MWRVVLRVVSAILLLAAGYEAVLVAWAFRAEYQAKQLSELASALVLGRTTQAEALDLFERRGWRVKEESCAPAGCSFFVSVANHPILLWPVPHWGTLVRPPFSPIEPGGFSIRLGMRDGVLDGIGENYDVGYVRVRFLRDLDRSVATTHTSEWTCGAGGRIVALRVVDWGEISDMSSPGFDFNSFFSVKPADARSMWPKAHAPTETSYGQPGCEDRAR